MDDIKVSVIIPVYNQEKYISTTLDSILNQNFSDFEIIVIDDGSTDNSLKIINDKLSNSQIQPKISHQENSGVGSARNKGIDEACGEYLLFVDGDDYISSNHLSELYNGVSDFSLTQLVKKNDDSTTSPYFYHKLEMSTEEFIKLELEMKIPFNFVQLLYKTDIIKNNNLKFSCDVIYGEDLEFALNALSYGNTIQISNETTYFYIQHNASAINTSGFKRFEIVNVLENIAQKYKDRNLNKLSDLIYTSRIPRAIFGNMNYFFYNDYDFDEVISQMEKLDLFNKLSMFKGDKKFTIKIKLFLFNPKLYYELWKKFKNSI